MFLSLTFFTYAFSVSFQMASDSSKQHLQYPSLWKMNALLPQRAVTKRQEHAFIQIFDNSVLSCLPSFSFIMVFFRALGNHSKCFFEFFPPTKTVCYFTQFYLSSDPLFHKIAFLFFCDKTRKTAKLVWN